jgi:5,10-methylenetetrahydromethanopterin reductase
VAKLSFGVGVPLRDPVDEECALASTAEELGYQFVWANDDRLGRDVFSVLGTIARSTRHVCLGPGVTNPYSRHPALIATALATLDELSGGRAVLGLGAGGTNHRALAIERRLPGVALFEAITVIRKLLAGSEVTLNGRVIQACQAKLDFVPWRASVPIYVGARGPKILEVAGQLADGVIIGNLASIEGWAYLLSCVRKGARGAGRDPREIKLVAWFYTCVADDAEAARRAVRPMVATSLITSRPILPELGITMPRGFAEIMEAQQWSLEAECVELAGREIPDEIVSAFSLAGTPQECRRQLHNFWTAFPQISQVVIVPAAGEGQQQIDVLRRFMREVAHPLVDEMVHSAGRG